MNLMAFDDLCRRACERLGLESDTALGLGGEALVDGVLIESMFIDGQDAFLLIADVGEIDVEDKAAVCERLLSMQLEAWDEPLVRFGLHPLHQDPVLCVPATLSAKTDDEWLAGLLKSVASQVNQWREGSLQGMARARLPAGISPSLFASPVQDQGTRA